MTNVTKSLLPAELLGRLEALRHRPLVDHANVLACKYRHPGEGNWLWHLPLEVLPWYHIIVAKEHGQLIEFFLLLPMSERILMIDYDGEHWARRGTVHESEVAQVIPDRLRAQNVRWFRNPATRAQLRTVARVSGVPAKLLPEMTAHGASIVITTSVIIPHLRCLRTKIDLWAAECGAPPHAPLLPFDEI